MLAILKREFRSLFWNIIGWLFIGLTLGIFGLYYYVYNLSYGYPYVSYSLSAISFLFLITVPLLTMRVFAEEKRSKTDQLLFTSPVSLGKIVLGKFLALGAVYTICIGVICMAPLVLSLFGEVPLLESYVAILGFWLYGLCCIAIGTFASSVTESQIISAVVTFVLLFLGYMMSSLCSVLSSAGNIITKILGCYDLYGPLNDFLNGTFSLTGALYYFSLIVLALFLTGQVLQKRRWEVSRKMLSFSMFSVGTICVVIAAVILLNVFASKIPTTYTQLDATSQKLYTITEDTISYVKTLKEDITIYVYAEKDSKDENVDKTLKKYQEASDHIKVTYVSPDSQPAFAKNYGLDTLNPNSLVVVCNDRYKVIDYGSSDYSYADSQIYNYEMDASSYSYTATGYDCEGQVTAALQYVTSNSVTKVYTLTGHKETALGGNFTEILDKRFITVESLNLLQEDNVPKDCAALLITAPGSDLSTDDAEKIKAYLDRGGHVLLSFDYASVAGLDNFRQLLSDYQLTLTEGLVGESDQSYYYQSPFYLLPYVEETEITGELAGNSSVFVPYALGLTYAGDEERMTSYLSTSESSFAKLKENMTRERTEEKDQAKMFEAEEGEEKKAYCLACQVTNEQNGIFFVVGSSYLFSDSADQMVSGRNAEFFNGIVNSLVKTKQENPGVVIPSKDYSVSPITVSQRTILVYGILWGLLMPVATIIFGIAIWGVRRKK